MMMSTGKHIRIEAIGDDAVFFRSPKATLTFRFACRKQEILKEVRRLAKNRAPHLGEGSGERC
jgi:hypothetical protein